MPTPGEQRKIGIVPYDTRLLPIAPPSVGIFDEPTRPICINVQWIPHVDGLLERLIWEDAWSGNDTDINFAIGEIRKLMIALALGNSCMPTFELRQNPDNDCEMQQSTDNGVTWTLAFDYSLCISPATSTQALNDVIDALNQLLADYDGTVLSVAPDVIYDATATDDIRDLAMCHALNDLIDLICEMEINYRSTSFLVLNVMGAISALIGLAISIGTLGTGTPLYMMVAGAVAGALGSVFGSLSDTVLNDDIARDAVVCCMYNALKGATPTQASFEASLSSCGFTGGTSEAQLAGAVSNWLTDDSVYESFLDYVQKSYKFAELGIADCPCDTGWEHVFDFTVADGGWVILTWGDGWVTGKGWQSQDVNNTQELAYLELFFADTVITFMEFEHWTDGAQLNFGAGSGDTATTGQLYLNGVVDVVHYEINNGTAVNRTIVAYDNQSGTTADRIRFTMNPFLDNPNKWYYKTVTVRGKGVNPFV